MTVEPSPTAPASPDGLGRLAELLADILGAPSAAIDGSVGDGVAEALVEHGMTATTAPGSDAGSAAMVVSLGVVSGASLEDARSHVDRLARTAEMAVVFSAADDDHLRFPPWWDELFGEHGFEPLDVLRARLWDDESWDAAALSSLTLYVRRSARSVIDGLERGGDMPRSAVHPGLLVPAWRDANAMRSLAARLQPADHLAADPVSVIERALDERSQSVEAAREELRHGLAKSRDVIQAVRAEAEQDRAALATAQQAGVDAEAARHEEEAARHRAEEESRLLRLERDAVAAAAASPPPATASVASRFAHRAAGAVGRRLEVRALAAAQRLEGLPGVAGRVSRRSVAVYRSMNVDWRTAMRDLFDVDYYFSQRPGLVGGDIDVVAHYTRHGWREGLDPHPLFDTDWYLRTHRSRIAADVSPLEHFVAGGWREGCDPHPLFDTDFYLRRSADVAHAGVNPLVHYLGVGWRQGRHPHPLFETRRYLDFYPDVRDSDVCPLVHYVTIGWQEGRSPGELFDAEWYVARYPEALASGLPPYRYYLEIGVRRGDIPSRWAERLHEPDPSSGERAAV